MKAKRITGLTTVNPARYQRVCEFSMLPTTLHMSIIVEGTLWHSTEATSKSQCIRQMLDLAQKGEEVPVFPIAPVNPACTRADRQLSHIKHKQRVERYSIS